ncbi:hypothetical protein [Balneola vulgaris]|jgi:hypothetical protein|uniref:hypothetical protein n=1 Tax=Balneola vulgaris TaxID=287535 RepID=UPI00036CE6A8|nr:hypothetical protein [Balneola vulgaris]
MNIDTRNKVLSIVLGIIIIGLTYVLYDSIITPYQEVIEKQEMTERVRTRMLAIKDVLVQYENTFGKFPPTEGGLDSVVQFVQTDSMLSMRSDSMFQVDDINQIVYSPRDGAKFVYTVNDTIRPPLYLLEDPGTDDTIGSLERTTMRNAPSWN